jgi:hypothetical protein
MPDDNAHAADDTRNLRSRFPRRGILFDPLESVVVAVRGKRTLVAATAPEKLIEQRPGGDRAGWGRPDPDVAYPPQPWAGLAAVGGGIAT